MPEHKKQKTIGSFFELGSANAAEALIYSGLDYIIIDTEHGPFAEEKVMELIRACKLGKLSPFVRIKEISRASVLRMLDIGAEAIVVPCVETVKQVKDLVKWGKYPPLGERGFFYGRAAAYGFEDFCSPLDLYFTRSNEGAMLIPQCETLGCLENIEEIAFMDGVDGIFVGPYDLSIALGKPGDFKTDEFRQAIVNILAACKKAGKAAMIYAANVETAVEQLGLGFDSVAVGTDIAFLVNSYKSMLKTLKAALE